MKKLLLLLLLLPTLIQAEVLYLVCEGTNHTDKITVDYEYDKKFYVEATDEEIKIDEIKVDDNYNDLTYFNAYIIDFKPMADDTSSHYSYVKDKEFIKLDSAYKYVRRSAKELYDVCSETNYSLEINRMTGKILTKYNRKNSCGTKLSTHNTFKGICKKRERTF